MSKRQLFNNPPPNAIEINGQFYQPVQQVQPLQPLIPAQNPMGGNRKRQWNRGQNQNKGINSVNGQQGNSNSNHSNNSGQHGNGNSNPNNSSGPVNQALVSNSGGSGSSTSASQPTDPITELLALAEVSNASLLNIQTSLVGVNTLLRDIDTKMGELRTYGSIISSIMVKKFDPAVPTTQIAKLLANGPKTPPKSPKWADCSQESVEKAKSPKTN